MTKEKREEANARGEERQTTWHRRRVEKFGKAFQNYRRAIIHKLDTKLLLDKWMYQWRGECPEHVVSVADMVWTEQDMDELIRTVASFDSHKRMWQKKRLE